MHRKRAPKADAGAGSLDRSAMQVDQTPHQRQADARASLGMPMPESSTAIYSDRSACQADKRIRPPGGVYFAALFNRLLIACAMRVGSISTCMASSERLMSKAC